MPSEPEESTAFSVICIFPLHLHRPCCYSARRPLLSENTWKATWAGQRQNFARYGLWSLNVRGVDDRLNDTATRQFVSFVWRFLFRWAHHQGSSTTCAATLLARHLTEYQNIITASEWANTHPQHLIGDDVDEWLIATTPLIERD